MDGFKIRGIYEEELVGMNSIGNGKKENEKNFKST